MAQDFLYLDLESYSDANLKQLGSTLYIRDFSTEIMMVSYALNDAPIKLWLPVKNEPMPDDLEDILMFSNTPLVAHNAIGFDAEMFNHRPGKRIGWPADCTPLTRWRDTQMDAYYSGYPGKLDHVAIATGLGYTKQKDGTRLINKFCTPRKPTTNNPATRVRYYDDPEDWERFSNYCIQDTEVLRGIAGILRVTPKVVREYHLMTHRMNTRGIHIDRPLAECALEFTEQYREVLEGEAKFITGGLKTSQRDKMLAWLAERDVWPISWSAPNVELELETNEHLDKDSKRILELRTALAGSATKKLTSMLTRADCDDLVYDTLQFYGAYRTGRWAARGIQIHNYPRGIFNTDDERLEAMNLLMAGDDLEFMFRYENPLNAVASLLRSMLSAPPGKVWHIADYKAIEARILVWLAQQNDAIKEFAGGRDAYIAMAAVIYGIAESEVTSEQRRVGKNTVLGCGYNMGWNTFRNQMYKQSGVWIPVALAKRCVNAYRKKHYKVQRFWHQIEACVTSTLRTGKPTTLTYLRFSYDKPRDLLLITLPSGRQMSYPQPRLKRVKRYGKWKDQITFGVQSGALWCRESTYGGKLTENVVQAIAADLMMYGMLHAEQVANYVFIFTVHDEGGAEQDIEFDKPISYMEKLICTLQPWAKGLPLGAEGATVSRYKKI